MKLSARIMHGKILETGQVKHYNSWAPPELPRLKVPPTPRERELRRRASAYNAGRSPRSLRGILNVLGWR